ncbi:MAG: V-type ATPase subunit [Candidatus Firestonebacteria bacterium]|nr:V-type ATPase subunit [Candidatus Firestonebacteria bacterium]
MLEIQSEVLQGNYGYVNARVRAMKSVLLGREFYEDLLKTSDFSGIMGLLDKTPYKTEIQECAISRSGVEGIDEALKRNLARTFRKILSFAGSEPRELILMILGRWDLHNIITILRGVHIKVPTEQILESLIPAGEMDVSPLNQLANEQSIKGCIDVLATWGSPYARVLNEKYGEYVEENDISILELALDKAYYANALEKLKKIGNINYKIVKNLIVYEIDAINVTTILRLQKLTIEDLLKRRKMAQEEEKKEVKAEPEGYISKTKAWWREMTTPIESSDKKSNIKESKLSIFWDNCKRLLKLKYKEYEKAKEILYKKIAQEKSVFKKIKLFLNADLFKTSNKKASKNKSDFKYLLNDIKQAYRKIEGILLKAKKAENEDEAKKQEEAQKNEEMRRNRIEEFYIPGGNEINKEHFINVCLNLDVEKVVKDLEQTSYGKALRDLMDRYQEYNTLSLLERKIEEMIITKSVGTYNKGPLSIGIPIGYIWKKYNEIVNLRIIVRCKGIGMPDRKIREELIIV